MAIKERKKLTSKREREREREREKDGIQRKQKEIES